MHQVNSSVLPSSKPERSFLQIEKLKGPEWCGPPEAGTSLGQGSEEQAQLTSAPHSSHPCNPRPAAALPCIRIYEDSFKDNTSKFQIISPQMSQYLAQSTHSPPGLTQIIL